MPDDPPEMSEVLARPAFSVDGVVTAWREVIDFMRFSGAWTQIEEYARAGLAAAGGPASDEVLQAVAERITAVRRHRGLLTAEETAAWLHWWGLSVREFREHIRRSLLAHGHADAAPDVATEALERAAWTEAVTSGALEHDARALAERRAAWRAAGGTGSPAADELGPARDRLVAAAVSEGGLARVVERRVLDWVRIGGWQVDLATAGQAREFAIGLREDQAGFEDLLARAGATARRISSQLQDLSPVLAAMLAGARPGDVVGPIPSDQSQTVVVVQERVEPALDDPAIRERAREMLAERAIRAAALRWVAWPPSDPWATSGPDGSADR
jgi:hypothetical protein